MFKFHDYFEKEKRKYYEEIKNNLKYSAFNEKSQVLIVAGSNDGIEKESTTARIAMKIAKEGYRTIIVNTNFRKKTNYKKIKVKTKIGLSEIILEEESINNTITTIRANLDLITAGNLLGKETIEKLDSIEFEEFIDNLREIYDCILLDSSSLGNDIDILSKTADGLLLVGKEKDITEFSLKLERKKKIESFKRNFKIGHFRILIEKE